MREILFRGKRIDNDEWIEGHYGEYMLMSGVSIHGISIPKKETVCGSICYDVEASTVGQYTGLTDKNGKKIFEGDIVKVTGLWPDRDGEQRIWRQFRVGEVFYYHGAFFFGKWGLQKTSEKCIEIIGNIHDNPELLEVGK